MKRREQAGFNIIRRDIGYIETFYFQDQCHALILLRDRICLLWTDHFYIQIETLHRPVTDRSLHEFLV